MSLKQVIKQTANGKKAKLSALIALIPLLIFAAIFATLGGSKKVGTGHASTSNVVLFNRTTYTNSTSASNASKYQLVDLQYNGGVTALIDSIHASDPGVKALIYQDAKDTSTTDSNTWTVCTNYASDNTAANAHPNDPQYDWFLKDQNGNRLAYSSNYPNDYQMDFGNSYYQQACLNHVLALAQAAHADGVFFDNIIATARLSLPTGTCAYYAGVCKYKDSDQSWQNAMTSLLNTIGPGLHGRHLLAIGNMSAASTSTGLWQQWNTTMDGAMEESWTDGGLGVAQQVPYWAQKFANAAWSAANNKLNLLHSYNTSEAGNTYGLASMLLVASGYASYTTSNSNYTTQENWYPEYTTAQQLGAPTGTYTQLSNGVYKRSFSGGVVLVNPTGNSTATFTLGGTYSGSGTEPTNVSSVAMAPTSGLILLNSAPPAAPSVSLTVFPASVASGGSSTLTWSSTNATSCTASGGWSGSKALSGSTTTGALSASTNYSLSCSGAGGTVSISKTVTVNGTPPPSAPTVSLTAVPNAVQSGGTSVLSWASTNATSCTASGGWSGSKPLSGSSSTGPLNTSTTYSLSCSGSGGTTSSAASVLVTAAPPVVVGQGGPPPVVGGTISLTTGAKDGTPTSCEVDGRPASCQVDTTKLADGTHSVEVQVKQPDGQVITKKENIVVNNHKPFWKNVLLRYGKPTAVGGTIASLLLLAGAIWYGAFRRRPFPSPHMPFLTQPVAPPVVSHNSQELPPGSIVSPDQAHERARGTKKD